MDVKNNKVDANGKKRKYIYESRYQQIAVELAQKIADGWYTIGEKISARSTLASNYNVSSNRKGTVWGSECTMR